MKSLYEQERRIFKRFADCNNGKYITAAKIEYLLGKDAVQYALNAADRISHRAMDWTIFESEHVFTFSGFSKAFQFFRMTEIKDGLYNAYVTPDYIDRQLFL